MHEQSFALPPLPSPAVRRWIIGVFFACTFLVYATSLRNAFVRWDDGLLIYENPALRAITPTTLKMIFTTYDPELYIPLTFLTYQIDFLIGGTHATIYHLQNLLWHTLNALLVAWFVTLLSRRGWAGILCGLLFALHPLHTEAVAWASARKDVLSTFFLLSSLIAYLYYRAAPRRTLFYTSVGLFALGLFAKVTILTLPVLLLLMDWRDRRTWNTEMITEKIPFFALTIAFAVIAWIGKTGVLGASTLMEKILMIPVSTLFYLQKLFLPIGLSVLYPFTGALTLSRPDVLLPFLALIILLVLMPVTLRWTREIAFGTLFFLITLSPSLLNFAKGNALYFASDRYAYVPSIGILFLATLLAAHLRERSLQWQRTIQWGSAIVLCLFGILAFRQSLVWKDSTALFENALAHYPSSFVAQNNLGNVARYSGDEARAIALYEQALASMQEAGREGPGIERAESKTLANLASAKREQGDPAAAQAAYNRALTLDPENTTAILGLGIIAGLEGRTAEAEASYRRAIAIAPDAATAHLNLGALLVGQGRLSEGIAEYRTTIALNPFYPQAQFNLGIALEKIGKDAEAADAYGEAINLQPKFTAARLNLGILLYNRKKIDEAVEQFEAILHYDPANRQAGAALRQIQ
ncbi:MAG: tetratricopeptide repeat protein [Candidatus Peribacteraceae bacterium]|nr:tetratricopeptide repeat protein [Candidatus Peribacteraceae bacterium]